MSPNCERYRTRAFRPKKKNLLLRLDCIVCVPLLPFKFTLGFFPLHQRQLPPTKRKAAVLVIDARPLSFSLRLCLPFTTGHKGLYFFCQIYAFSRCKLSSSLFLSSFLWIFTLPGFFSSICWPLIDPIRDVGREGGSSIRVVMSLRVPTSGRLDSFFSVKKLADVALLIDLST